MTILLICVVWVAIFLLLLIRNEMVFRVQMKAIRMVSKANRRLLFAGNYGVDGYWSVFESYQGYNAMFLDCRKWTFDQFYPGLKQKVAA